MVYTANWGIICHLPPFRGTRNNHWLLGHQVGIHFRKVLPHRVEKCLKTNVLSLGPRPFPSEKSLIYVMHTRYNVYGIRQKTSQKLTSHLDILYTKLTSTRKCSTSKIASYPLQTTRTSLSARQLSLWGFYGLRRVFTCSLGFEWYKVGWGKPVGLTPRHFSGASGRCENPKNL